MPIESQTIHRWEFSNDMKRSEVFAKIQSKELILKPDTPREIIADFQCGKEIPFEWLMKSDSSGLVVTKDIVLELVEWPEYAEIVPNLHIVSTIPENLVNHLTEDSIIPFSTEYRVHLNVNGVFQNNMSKTLKIDSVIAESPRLMLEVLKREVPVLAQSILNEFSSSK